MIGVRPIDRVDDLLPGAVERVAVDPADGGSESQPGSSARSRIADGEVNVGYASGAAIEPAEPVQPCDGWGILLKIGALHTSAHRVVPRGPHHPCTGAEDRMAWLIGLGELIVARGSPKRLNLGTHPGLEATGNRRRSIRERGGDI